jgi:hypothetical protein
MKNIFHLLIFVLGSYSSVSGQVSIPSNSTWQIPIELATSDIQFLNRSYSQKNIKQVQIQYFSQSQHIYFNSEGYKIKSETYVDTLLLKQCIYLYSFFTDSIQVNVTTLFFYNQDTTQSYPQNFTFIDSIAEYPSGHRRHPYRYILYNLQGSYINSIDKTPEAIKKEQSKNKFAHKYSGGGHRVHAKKIYSSKEVLIKEVVNEYDYFIASTPEYSNETEYIVKFKYYRNGLLKSCNGFKFTYEYFTKK